MTNRISAFLSQSASALAYDVGVWLKGQVAPRAVMETDECAFAIEPYAEAGHCIVREKRDVHQQRNHHWLEKHGIHRSIENVWLEIDWRGKKIEALRMQWFAPSAMARTEHRFWLVAETMEVADEFFSEVCKFNSEIRDEVLVFEGGTWSKNEELFKSIQGATLDTLVLPFGLKNDLVEDVTGFFGARELYEEHGVPHKRGILLVGPPGNGKTLAIKALVNHVKKPCLYVKSLEASYSTPHASIRAVFARARESAPCIMVLEDLDSLINDGNKSYFLNEVDGFASNAGILTIATTNHPEKLDVAIVDRPSRFDRKYPFTLPAVPERVHYMEAWNATLRPALRLDDEPIMAVAQAAEGFSYAYIKELFFSSMMKWIASGKPHAMKEIMLEQVEVLRSQMASNPASEPKPPPSETAEAMDIMGQYLSRKRGRD
jgi:hypothetical protein